MGELGYLDDPAFELGMLSAQAMRAVRVIVDIGMHLELPIPARERYHPGDRWTPEIALPFVIERSCFPEDFMKSEVDRYLGLPGQAISYKVGEREWLAARADAQAAQGRRLRPQGLPLAPRSTSAAWASRSSAASSPASSSPFVNRRLPTPCRPLPTPRCARRRAPSSAPRPRGTGTDRVAGRRGTGRRPARRACARDTSTTLRRPSVRSSAA